MLCYTIIICIQVKLLKFLKSKRDKLHVLLHTMHLLIIYIISGSYEDELIISINQILVVIIAVS